MNPDTVLLALLDAADELERVLDADWPAIRDELAALIASLDSGLAEAELRDRVSALVKRLSDGPARDILSRIISEVIPNVPRRGPGQLPLRQPPLKVEPPTGRVILPILYATNRARSEDPRLFYGSKRGPQLEFGLAHVNIPLEKPVAMMPRPSLWRFELRENPEKHVMIIDEQRRDRATFLADLRGAMAVAKDARDVLLFIHGYNVRFADALRRTAQIAKDLMFPGQVLAYSWPSFGRFLDYSADGEAAVASVPYLESLLVLLLTEAGVERVYILAHSMGNRALVQTLLNLDGKGLPPRAAALHRIVFAAPDVDVDVFDFLAAYFQKRPQECTLYASGSDLPLRLSRLLFSRYPRAGDLGRLVIRPGLDTIDASETNTSLFGLGHSYFADRFSVLNDIKGVVEGQPVNRRINLLSRPGPYWYLKQPPK